MVGRPGGFSEVGTSGKAETLGELWRQSEPRYVGGGRSLPDFFLVFQRPYRVSMAPSRLGGTTSTTHRPIRDSVVNIICWCRVVISGKRRASSEPAPRGLYLTGNPMTSLYATGRPLQRLRSGRSASLPFWRPRIRVRSARFACLASRWLRVGTPSLRSGVPVEIQSRSGSGIEYWGRLRNSTI